MTNHWSDIANSDCIIAIASNPAENHPASFGWIMKAKDRGAKLISVDPRFTRTSAKADIFAKLRSGTDIAFMGGMIKYVLEDMEANPGNYNMTYVREYTNAPYLIDPDFKGPADLDGLFSGYAGAPNETDGAKRTYDKSTWKYQTDADGIPRKDKSLEDPNCVFQLLRRHFARYNPDIVSNITGTPKETFLEVARTYAATGRPGKAGTIMYAMGATQSTHGVQNIRSYAILQLLLGNIGVTGGGINALRGESNVQGSTDHCLLAHILPGYLNQPKNKDRTLADYTKAYTPVSNDPLSLNWWKHKPKYIVSLLKAWYGAAATAENEFGYQYLPKTTKPINDYSWIGLFEAMYAGTIKGLMCWGQNPAVSGPNLNLEREAFAKLDWLVVADLWETETAGFWKRPGVDPASINTEVFLLPAVCSYEKEGSVTNSGRWAQWRYKAVEGPGDSRSDLDMINDVMLKLRELYGADPAAPHREAITNLTWDYGAHPDPNQVAREINGYDLTTGKLVPSFGKLKDDGTTSSGNWLYAASYTEEGNMMARRDPAPGPFNVGLSPKWAWCWPVNRRIIYNRASVDLDGQPWDREHPVIWWQDGKWVGDVPDGGAPPVAEGGYHPFIMKTEGHSRIFGAGRSDGPLPEHYEPWESPVKNLMSGQQNGPTFKVWAADKDLRGDPERFPIVATTVRLSEHWQAGQMTRNTPWTVELFPEMFMELSPELAAEKGVSDGDMVIVESARGRIEVRANVTERLQPFQLNGQTVHQVALPWHWGYTGLSTGDSANILTPHVGDPNTMIPEFKAFLCNVRKA